MKPIVIIGSGGHAREILDIIIACNEIKATYQVIGFIDDDQSKWGINLNGYPILGDFNWFTQNKLTSTLEVICAVGNPVIRQRLAKRAQTFKLRFCNLIHPTVLLTQFINLGTGVVITANTVLTNQINIGNHVHINLGSTISHDCTIDSFCTLAPGVHIAGNVHIKQGCDIGIGTNVIQGITIGEWSIIGAGAAVVKNLPANCTAVGIPAKVIKQREEGWQYA